MRIAIALAVATLLLAACNLSEDVSGGPTLPPAEATTTPELPPTEDQPTALPGVLPLQTPGVLPTRTPLGQTAPLGEAVTPAPDALPTSATGESALITSPASGSSIPVGVLQVSGQVMNLRDDAFTLVLRDAGGQVLNSQFITLQNPNDVAEVPWSASMTTGSYTGPARIEVIAANPLGEEILLARADVTLASGGASSPAAGAGLSSRSTSPVASITSPAANAVVGETIPVSGEAGGIPDNQFVVVLVGADGNVLSSRQVSLTNDDYTLVVPWSVALSAGGYRGPAQIRAFTTVAGAQVTLASVPVALQ